MLRIHVAERVGLPVIRPHQRLELGQTSARATAAAAQEHHLVKCAGEGEVPSEQACTRSVAAEGEAEST